MTLVDGNSLTTQPVQNVPNQFRPAAESAPNGRLWQRHSRRWAARAAAGLNGLFGRRFDRAFGILTYHRVAWPVAGLPRPTWNVTPRQLKSQLAWLLARGYEAWPLRRALEYHQTNGKIPRHVFVVTFDDGYENFYRHAWPVLRELDVPATVLLATAYLDSDAAFPFDDWAAAGSKHAPADSWRPLSTVQCQELLDGGLTELGTHTHTHQVFRGRSAQFAEDMRNSLAVLNHRFGIQDVTFSFPYGIADVELVDAARMCGARCSLTTRCELVTPNADPFAWGRFGVSEFDTGRTLAAKLDGWYSAARGVWQRLGAPFRRRGCD